MLLTECGIVLVALLLAFLAPKTGSRLFAPIERQLGCFAKRRSLAIITVGVVALGLRAAVLPILPIPYPALHDEFSYQLMADTFAHGRVTNPTHPLWVHFETIFVIHRPTYCSMYYPAHGMFMALGQVLGGHPFWGIWLSIGAMCAAICWMLQGWLPPLWALMGGLLAAVRIGAFSYWSNSYWGGSVTAIGGALVLGALPRLGREQRVSDGLLLGAGFALLATSRPYESLFFSIPVLASVVIWMLRNRRSPRRWLPLAISFGLVLTATAAFMLYYFWRTTGNPLLPPYIVNLRTYAVDPNFAWLPLRPVPLYHNELVHHHYTGWDVDQYVTVRTHPVLSSIVKIMMLWFFYFGPLLSLPILTLAFVLPNGTSIKDVPPKIRFLFIVCAATVLAELLAVPTNPHYAASVTAAMYALVLTALQRIRHWRPNGRPAGVFVVRTIPTAAVALLILRIAIPVFHLPISNPATPWTWCSPWYQMIPRAEVEKRLQSLPGQHVVFVHYRAEPKDAWVANRANIDDSKIIWANDMGSSENQELIRYFAGRHIWVVYPDENPIQLLPYSASDPATAPVKTKDMDAKAKG
jgi:hypothetical protein